MRNPARTLMIINTVGMLLHIYETFTATAAEAGQDFCRGGKKRATFAKALARVWAEPPATKPG